MTTDTKKAFAIAALIVATGVAGVELTRSTAQAESAYGPGIPAYAVSRIDAVFEAAAGMPPVESVRVPMAKKGDLPIPLGCLWVPADQQSECMDIAYEVPSVPSIVVETRFGSTSTLMRMDAMTVAEFADEERQAHSE
jgi:hypothetical protein